MEDCRRSRLVTLAKNYIGQLRFYSAADLVLLLAATGASTRDLVGGLALWFGFLVYLEWVHKDRDREPWHWTIWVALGLVGLILTANIAGTLVFAVTAALYAEKKRLRWLSPFSWLVNGGVKATLLIAVGGVTLPMIMLVWIVMSLRNLAGDLRDIEKDSSEGVHSLPVVLKIGHDIKWAYPTCLAATTLLWWTLGHLPVAALVIAWAVEASTYKLTPR